MVRVSTPAAAEFLPMARERNTPQSIPMRALLAGLLAGLALSCGVSAEESAPRRPDPVIAPSEIPTAVPGGRLERSVFIPMRDGVLLATDIYFPPDASRPLSTILMRTPYRKGNSSDIAWAHFFASHGFVVVVQDVRGRWESQGIYSFYSDDQRDFGTVTDWISAQRWSNQRIGTFGCSYLGEIQLIQSGAGNPHLKAMLPEASSGGTGSAEGRYRYFSGVMGGAYELEMASRWFPTVGSIIFARLDPNLPRKDYLDWIDRFQQYPPVPKVDDPEAMLRSLPVVGMFDRAGFPPTNFNEYVTIPLNSPLWEQRGFLSKDSKVDVPSLFVNGWYDYGIGESLAQYRFFRDKGLSERSRQGAHLIITPSTHCGDVRAAESSDFVVGDRDVGDTRFPLREIYARWFDYWLNKQGVGRLDLPPVSYFLMGKNEWRNAQDMPVPGTRFTKYYLGASKRGANSLAGDGSLETGDRPPKGRKFSEYVYDPGNPTPMISGPACCDFQNRPPGSFDQRGVESRTDTLVFSTEPLASGIEVTGPLKMVLYVSSDAPDTDFYGKLVDVYPDGRAFLLQEGILRARYRDGFDQVELMKPGRIYRVEVDLQATSNFFANGHRIRLEVASSHFPRFDRNLNTGGSNETGVEWRVARNRIYHDGEHRSYLLLPIVPGG